MSKVSILVPVYGVEKFIERCAISLFEQTFADIEFIFVNDCTPDNSIEILGKTIEKYPHRKSQVQIINHEVNKGLAGARNTGVERASGDYILHVDSDDYLELDTIELLYKKAIEETADIVTCDFLLEWENTSKVAKQKIGDSKVHCIQLMLSTDAMVGLVNKLIKRSLYVENNIKSFEGINLGEDFVTTPRLVYFSNKIVKVDIPLYHYIKINENSYTKNISKTSIDNIIFVFRELTSFFENKQDYSLYSNYILRGKLKKKIELIMNVSNENTNYVLEIFPEVESLSNIQFLSKTERFVSILIRNRNIYILEKYRKYYNKLFQFIQKLKGRNS